MSVERELEYLKRRLTQNSIKVSNNDKRALNNVIIALNDLKTERLNDNVSFCKLFISIFKDLCNATAQQNENSEPNFRLIHQTMDSILNIDATEHIEALYLELSQLQIQGLINKGELTKKNLSKVVSREQVNRQIRNTLQIFLKKH